MSFPAGVLLRAVTAGVPFGLADGQDLSIEATFTPSRSMIWQALGFAGIAREYRVTGAVGMQISVPLPVTDQVGWVDGLGNALTVANGAQTHTYGVHLRVLDSSKNVVADLPVKNIALPAGDFSDVDLDTLLPVSTTGGVTIAIPDSWSQAVTDARIASVAAQSAVAALTSSLPLTYLAKPTNGSSGQVLTLQADGSAAWVAVGGGTTIVDNGDGTLSAA